MNYRNKSGKGVSLTFLWIWLIADIANIIGALMEHLLLTLLLVAVYYTIGDALLIGQIKYYKRYYKNGMPMGDGEGENIGEGEPLVRTNTLENLQMQEKERARTVSVCVVLFLFIFFGIELLGLAQFFGWTSAVLYIGSRAPQILKNYRKKSTDGLALHMFVFALLGNVTYVMSVLLYSTEKHYVMQNLPWIVGSSGTLFFDVIVFGQFFYYNRASSFVPQHINEDV